MTPEARCGDPVILKLDLVLAYLRFNGPELCFGGGVRGFRLVELRRADGAGREQRTHPIELLFGEGQVGLTRGTLRLSRMQRGLREVRIDLHQWRARGHAVAGLHEDLPHEALHLRLNGGRAQRPYRGHEFRGPRYRFGLERHRL